MAFRQHEFLSIFHYRQSLSVIAFGKVTSSRLNFFVSFNKIYPKNIAA